MSKQCPNCEYYKTEYTLKKRTRERELVFLPIEFGLQLIFCMGISLIGFFVINIIPIVDITFYILTVIWLSISVVFIKGIYDEKNNHSGKSDFYKVDRETEVVGRRYTCNNCGYTWSEQS